MISSAKSAGASGGSRNKVAIAVTQNSIIAPTRSAGKSASNGRQYDPVAANRAIARKMSDYELLCWRGQECANLHIAPQESPVPEHDRMIVAWRLTAIDAELDARANRRQGGGGTEDRFSPEFVGRLKQCISLVELIMQHGDVLRKTGKSWRGPCPLHGGDNGSSLSVSESKGLWHCFTCGRGGDAVTWVIERWDMTFIEAIRFLSVLTGIETPDRNSASISRQQVRSVDVREADPHGR